MASEIRPIPGLPGYLASDDGEIYGPRNGLHKPLTQRLDKGGYCYVHLYDRNKKSVYPKVHRVVAGIFLPNTYNKPQVNHKDGNKQNNKLENLEWVTCQENFDHAKNNNLTATGSRHGSKTSSEWKISHIGGESHYRSLLSNTDANRIKKIHNRVKNHYGLNKKLAQKFNVGLWVIENIVYGRTYERQ